MGGRDEENLQDSFWSGEKPHKITKEEPDTTGAFKPFINNNQDIKKFALTKIWGVKWVHIVP